MNDEELSIALDNSFEKEKEIMTRLLISNNDESIKEELKKAKEKTNNLIDEYYKRSNNNQNPFDFTMDSYSYIEIFNKYNKVVEEKKNSETVMDYAIDELDYNLSYKRSVLLIKLLKWYISTHEMKDEDKKKLIEMFLSYPNTHIAARNELTDINLDLEVNENNLNILDAKVKIANLFAIKDVAQFFKAKVDLILDKNNGDATIPLIYESLLIASDYKLSMDYGLPLEEFNLEIEVGRTKELIRENDAYKNYIDKADSLFIDSAKLLDEYINSNEKEKTR